MYSFKGFVTNDNLIDNTFGIIAPIGEISAVSLTYAKDKGLYALDAYPELNYHSFHSVKNDLVGTIQKVEVPFEMIAQILKMSKVVYQAGKAYGPDGFVDLLRAEISTQFPTEVLSVTPGAIRTYKEVTVPEYLVWTTQYQDEDVEIKIWFVDQAFQEGYEEYEIVIIPPLKPLDAFFRRSQDVKLLLDARTHVETMEMIQAAKAGESETIIGAAEFEYIDPQNKKNRLKTNWSYLIFGAAGNNLERIKQAISEYILSNSAYVRDNWMTVLPDIFRRNEFTLLPFWRNYSIEARVLESGLYSPVTSVAESLALARAAIAEYPQLHINSYLDLMNFPYKGINIAVVGSDENKDDLFRLKDHFPDFINVSPISYDFNRMTVKTQTWANKILKLIMLAEGLTPTSGVPIGYTRVVRNGLTYVADSYLNMQYMVAAKFNTYPA